MQRICRFRIPAFFCAFAVLLCELIAHPFTTMGVCDDGPYILIAQKLATTGHIFYNGNTTPILGWQLYLAAAFIKLFGFSFTAVRMSTLLVAMALAFVLQRILVRANITERNATIGTLALVISPLYLMLSATFMTDIPGLFAILICLYGCMRALQSSPPRSAIAWLYFAVAINALCGTSRQTAWLGILVIVPSTLWLLRAKRRVLLAGVIANLAGALFILSCMAWFQHQPYNVHEPLFPSSYPLAHILTQYTHALLELPLLLLAPAFLFIPELRQSTRRSTAISVVIFVAYLLLAVHSGHNWKTWLEPTLEPASMGQWINTFGSFGGWGLQGQPSIFLNTAVRLLLTIVSLGGVFGLVASLFSRRRSIVSNHPSTAISWKQLGTLLAPYTLVYTLLLISRAASTGIFDRYLLGLVFIPLICLIRYYQDRIHPQLPMVLPLLIGIMAVFGIAATHNAFSLYRARVVLASELRASGVPDTSVDNGWEYNMVVELNYTDHLNDPRTRVPANAYISVPVPPGDSCKTVNYDLTPHVHPLYTISFDPNLCYGPASFAPVHYSRWLAFKPGTLYVVHYTSSQGHGRHTLLP